MTNGCPICWQDFANDRTSDHFCEAPITTEADRAAEYDFAMDGGNFHTDGSLHTGDDDGHHSKPRRTADEIIAAWDAWTASHDGATIAQAIWETSDLYRLRDWNAAVRKAIADGKITHQTMQDALA